MPHWAIADLINWGWLHIGPPYIYININPVIFQIGPLAVRWYGLMYVVGILAGLQVIAGYIARKGISEEALYRTLWWCIAAGLLGGRLYFVIQQHNLVQDYLQKPWRILATWEGGMAFYGAIFLVIPTLYWRARVERLNPLVLIDAGVLFATVGQIFGRIGNLINGDIIGYTSTLPWSTVYVNLNSWACSPYVALPTCGTPVQPAAGYELISNLILLVGMLYLARRVTRPGVLMLVYLFSYNILQFFLFFVRDNSIETPFGLNWGLKQAQWTALVFFIVLFPITYWVLRSSKPVPAGKIAATYGIPQRFKKQYQQDSLIGNEAIANKDKDTPHWKQGPSLGSEDTEVIIKPDPDTDVDLDSTEVILQPASDPIIEADNTEVTLLSESETSTVLESTLVDAETDSDPTTSSDETHIESNTSSMPDSSPISDETPTGSNTSSKPDLSLTPDDAHIEPETSLASSDTPIESDSSPEPASDTASGDTEVELDTSSESASSSASDDTQAEPDPSLVSDETQVEPNSSLVPDNTQAEPELADKTPIQIRITNQKKKSRFRTQF